MTNEHCYRVILRSAGRVVGRPVVVAPSADDACQRALQLLGERFPPGLVPTAHDLHAVTEHYEHHDRLWMERLRD